VAAHALVEMTGRHHRVVFADHGEYVEVFAQQSCQRAGVALYSASSRLVEEQLAGAVVGLIAGAELNQKVNHQWWNAALLWRIWA
jgi:hypothetical protein